MKIMLRKSLVWRTIAGRGKTHHPVKRVASVALALPVLASMVLAGCGGGNETTEHAAVWARGIKRIEAGDAVGGCPGLSVGR